MNKQNYEQKRQNSPLAERLNSPLADRKHITSNFIKTEQYYLEKLKSQREKIELLIREFQAFEKENQQLKEALEKKGQQLQKSKAQNVQKKSELEKVTEKLQESQDKLRETVEEYKQLDRNSNDEKQELLRRIRELEAKCSDYEEYLETLRDETLEEDRVRKEFETKRNQEVDRIEKIFGRIRARGIDLPPLAE